MSHGGLHSGLVDGRTLRVAVRSLFVLCLLAAACTGASLPPAGAQEQALEIHSRSLHLKSDEPAATSVGRLLWRGGISMRADSRSFGGWSDLHVTADGRTLTSISDEGPWFTATIDYDADGNLAGLSNGQIGNRLHVSPKTVDHHVSSVLAKLGAASRHEATRIAHERGLIAQNREDAA